MTKHLLVTDHYHDVDALRAISERVKSGQPVTFDEATLKAHRVDAETLRKTQREVAATCAAFLAVAAAGIAWAVWLLVR
jgi:hypothetical protein